MLLVDKIGSILGKARQKQVILAVGHRLERRRSEKILRRGRRY
jgi:hypothetical protein